MEQDYCNKRSFKTLVEDYVDSQMFSSAFSDVFKCIQVIYNFKG
jgi:hypothetical protein